MRQPSRGAFDPERSSGQHCQSDETLGFISKPFCGRAGADQFRVSVEPVAGWWRIFGLAVNAAPSMVMALGRDQPLKIRARLHSKRTRRSGASRAC